MPLEWDVKLDSVSIRDEISTFNIRESKGSYVRELTLVSVDPDFYNQFAYTDIPSATVEVLTKVDAAWVSQGSFFVEKPVMIANEDGTTSPGVWGRSESAKAGPPFAQKVSRYWETDTTFTNILTQMGVIADITITSEVNNYNIIANTYVVDNLYPIDVINELADFIGAYVACTNDGNLVIKQDTYHPLVAVHTLTDDDIADVSENQELPDFGNRIRISALGGVGSGYSITIEAVDDSDCLPADGASTGTLLAFVNDAENNPAPNNTMVSWETETGVTLEQAVTATQNYLLVGKKHTADNFYEVTVDYPIESVVGIWAYSDSGNLENFWDEEFGSVSGNTITVHSPFAFCDQSLRITYVTSGCAVNRVTAGTVALDVTISADVEGARDEIEIKLGNTCACGSSLNIKANPPDDVCLGNLGHLLVWATVSKIPATGQDVKIRITKGCGVLSSENKKLKNVEIRNEATYAENVISGTTQCESEIDISSAQVPRVYAESDTSKSNDLYASHDGRTIDLDTSLETGTKLLINYHAEGATLVSWRTLGEEKDCDAEITVSMSDGTEAGLLSEITLHARDCSLAEIPDYNEDYDEYDPEYSDYGDDDSGGFEDSGNDWTIGDPSAPGGGGADPCLAPVMNRILNADNATNDAERDGYRFGTQSPEDCPESGFPCPCSELCDSEVREKGNTYDKEVTIHQEVLDAGHEEGTPEYTESFNTIMNENIAQCAQDCEDNRLLTCGDCDTVVGPATLSPGSSAEYTCSNGVSKIITMPEGHCGSLTETVGCCTVDIKSTVGHWELIEGGGWSYLCFNCYDGKYKTTWCRGSVWNRGWMRCGIYGPDNVLNCEYEGWNKQCYHPCPDDYTFPDSSYECVGETYIAKYEWQC